MADLEETKTCFTRALYHNPSPISARIDGGRGLLLFLFILEDPQAYTIARVSAE